MSDPIDPAVPDELEKTLTKYGLYHDRMADDIRALFRAERLDELLTLARNHWQTSIPEQAVLDRIAELKAKAKEDQ